MACGAVFRGPPLRLTPGGCLDADALSIRTIIDLRTESERNAVPDAACVQAARVLAPLPIPYGLAPADYLRDLRETASIAAAFHTLGDPNAYPIYLHCTWGRDRTGVVGALFLLALGADRATVMQEYQLSAATVGAYPSSLAAVLDEVETLGGIDKFLATIGISRAELAAMRARAIAD